MNKNISVIIPTLQKNEELLKNLINSLYRDDAVDEIIVIDNAAKGLNMSNDKLRIIVPESNLYVNPSWNLGVKEAKNEIVALLNDDITIPENFCGDVAAGMSSDMGVVGFDRTYIEVTEEIKRPPVKTNISLLPLKYRPLHWGVAIFCFKTSYFEIPDELKIFYGDDWLFLKNKKEGKTNYQISGQRIFHYGSLSSKSKNLNPITKQDKKIYKKLTLKWWQHIFNFEFVYGGFRLTVFGIEFVHHWSKKH